MIYLDLHEIEAIKQENALIQSYKDARDYWHSLYVEWGKDAHYYRFCWYCDLLDDVLGIPF